MCYGINKDQEKLPQINLAMMFGEKSNLPFYYRKLPGNISDVKTVKNLLADMQFPGYDRIKLVMDRGFYSKAKSKNVVNLAIAGRSRSKIENETSVIIHFAIIASFKTFLFFIKH